LAVIMEDANFLGILAYRVHYIYAHRHDIYAMEHTKTGKEKYIYFPQTSNRSQKIF